MKAWRIAFAGMTSLALSAVALAQTASTEANHNITVQPAGPRTGTSGLNFFNIEGNANGTFASFGVAEFLFDASAFTDPIAGIKRLTLKLYQVDAGFSESGNVNLWLTNDTATSTAQVGSPLVWDANALPDGVGSQLETKWKLATFAYDELQDDGFETVVDVNAMDAAAESYLIGQLNADGLVRLIISPDSDTTAATYAGFSNSTFTGPTIEIEANPVPEPATMAALAIGAAAVLRRRRA